MGARMNDPARQAFEKALTIDPSNQTARKGLQGLLKAGTQAPNKEE